jgi:hypothetical protein
MKNEKHELEKIKWGVIPVVNYRGCNVVKNLKTGTYSIFGRTGVSSGDVDRIIDESLGWLKNGLKGGKTGIISTLG